MHKNVRVILPIALSSIALATSSSSAERESNSEAFVRVSPRDARYFELSDSSPYIPIGLNMIAPPGRGLAGMEQWMRQLGTNGGNFIRVWLSNPFFDVEAQRSGEYDPAKAQRIADMLAAARQNGLRVKMCLEHFRHLGEGRQTWAGKPLHHVANGGTATNIADFFNGARSRNLFKRKLAWYADRFGSNPTIFGWELWNEINAVSGGDYMAWTAVMLPELHQRFPSNLCMQSLGSYDTDGKRAEYRRLALMPGNDVAQVHRYLDLGARLEVCKGLVHRLAADAVNELLVTKPGKPVILAESGAVEPGHTGPFKLYAKDTNGMILHDVLFAPFFAGAAGPGHIWHWDAYVAKNNLWWHFGRFAETVRGIDPPAEHFQPTTLPHERLDVAVLEGTHTWLLWCRDTKNDWRSELQNGKPPESVNGAAIDLRAKAADVGGAKVRCYEPWRDRWSESKIVGGKIALPEFQRSLVVKIDRAK